ncbi:MAG: hypothetical protein ACYC9L_16955 [Sulfuricaulis sp.]
MKHDRRTLLQNKSMHLYFELLATALNDAGYSVQKTLRHDVEIPWSGSLIKELIWKPIQEAMTDKKSTTELDTVEPDAIHAVLSRHLGERFSIFVPWPSEESKHGNM